MKLRATVLSLVVLISMRSNAHQHVARPAPCTNHHCTVHHPTTDDCQNQLIINSAAQMVGDIVALAAADDPHDPQVVSTCIASILANAGAIGLQLLRAGIIDPTMDESAINQAVTTMIATLDDAHQQDLDALVQHTVMQVRRLPRTCAHRRTEN